MPPHDEHLGVDAGKHTHLNNFGSAKLIDGDNGQIALVLHLMQGVPCNAPIVSDTENGEWLYANDVPQQGINHMAGDRYDHHQIQMQQSGVPWVTGLPSPGYHQVIEQHTIFAHDPNYSHYWNVPPVPTEISITHVIQTFGNHYRNWLNHFVFTPMVDHNSGANQASVQSATLRFAQVESDSRPGPESFAHPVILDHGSGSGTLGFLVSSTGLPYTGSNAPAHDRVQVLRQQPLSNSPSPVVLASILSGIWRSNRSRGLISSPPTVSSPDQTGDFYPVLSLGLSNQNLQQEANPSLVQRHAWETDGTAPSEHFGDDMHNSF
ncbi:hypothetical protein L1049_017170 [Liquidambar formosana]|uniref:Uncharacterized protein n=1 Tax=Liquidambar formosana TaxID=63359 RepID=A0AAP0S744_LIQFO